MSSEAPTPWLLERLLRRGKTWRNCAEMLGKCGFYAILWDFTDTTSDLSGWLFQAIQQIWSQARGKQGKKHQTTWLKAPWNGSGCTPTATNRILSMTWGWAPYSFGPRTLIIRSALWIWTRQASAHQHSGLGKLLFGKICFKNLGNNAFWKTGCFARMGHRRVLMKPDCQKWSVIRWPKFDALKNTILYDYRWLVQFLMANISIYQK